MSLECSVSPANGHLGEKRFFLRQDENNPCLGVMGISFHSYHLRLFISQKAIATPICKIHVPGGAFKKNWMKLNIDFRQTSEAGGLFHMP